jgi:ADP-ribose pyrophosphatase YjhB (NUDIX family)
MDKLFQRGIDDIGIGTLFICHDGKGNILMQKRSDNRKTDPSAWDVGAGTLEWGLSLGENVRREVKEEYCADVLAIEFLGYREIIDDLNWKKQHWICFDYKVLVNPKTVAIGEPDKVTEIGWFTKDKLPSPLHALEEIVFKKYWEKI